ncbi:hypothetical protein F5Y12DRAFT_713212 [Xylaria sp. FL1777]|nr:hypothetical protein F5Y12DRAFT_713212 [Xylaria sp. FL1777]
MAGVDLSPATGAHEPTIPRDVLITGHEDPVFRFYHDGFWHTANKVIDNGVNKGYSAYHNTVLLGQGKLVVWDAVDHEMDVLNGGPLGRGWFTHRRLDALVEIPSDIITNYRKLKAAFRHEYGADSTRWPSVTCRGGQYDHDSIGKRIYALAPIDPCLTYGLRETEETAKRMDSKLLNFRTTPHCPHTPNSTTSPDSRPIAN